MTDLPRGWERTTLGEVAFPDREKVAPSTCAHLEFIGMEHIEAHTMRLIGSVPAATMKSAAVRFFSGDVLYGRLRPYLNKVHVARGEGLCSAEFIAFADRGHLNPWWLAYRVNAADFVSFATHLNEGDRPRVDFSQIGSFVLLLPPRPEQDSIVAEIEKQFTRLDDAVNALKRVQASLKRYRASVLKAACEGRLVPTEAEFARKEGRSYEPASELLKRILTERRATWEADQRTRMQAAGMPPRTDDWKKKYKDAAPPETVGLPELPEGWTWATLGQLSWASDYGTSEKCDYAAAGLPVLRVPNIVGGRLDLTDLKHATKTRGVATGENVLPGDLLIIRTNGSRHLIGRAALVTTYLDRPHLHASYLIRFRLVAAARWLSAIWDAPAMRGVLEGHAATSAGQYNVSMTELATLPVPLPPAAEGERIASGVERNLSVIEATLSDVAQQLQRAGALRQAALATAFSGKLVPQDPADEPASVLLERIRAERAMAQNNNIKRSARPRRTMRNAKAGVAK